MGVTLVKPIPTLLTKTTAAQNDVTLSYHRVRGLYFLAVVFARSIDLLITRYSIQCGNSRVINIS